jgi:prepilin-type N-terminal cleavage/methylation domain-containing protein
MSVTGDIRRAHNPASSGFTLIEMLVTLGIAALVAGLIFPALQRSLDYWSQRAALASVRAALAEARSLALRTASPVPFALDANGDGFSVARGEIVRLPGSARVSGSTSSITFYPDSSATGGRIAVRSGTRQGLLVVSPDTGLTSYGE